MEFYVSDKITSDTFVITLPAGTPLISKRRKMVGINNRNPVRACDVNGAVGMNGYNVMGFVKALGNTEDLNSLTEPGIYTQAANANASTNRHYPKAVAGYLEVMCNPSGYVLQRYTAYDCSGLYIRHRYQGSWGSWKSVSLS